MTKKLGLKIKHTFKGRAVRVESDGTVYIGHKYKVYAYRPGREELELVCKVPCPAHRKAIEPFRLVCRLFRHEIRGFILFSDGSKVVAPRQGLFYGESGDFVVRPANLPELSPELKPPTSLTVDFENRLLWGEYYSNAERREVRLCSSFDKGKNYEVIYTFKAGEIRHVHSIQEDMYDNCYWIFAGDHGTEPGIGRLSRDFKSFEWLVKGQQKHRACVGFVFKDKIIYGTDSEKEPNGIYAIDKASGNTEKLCDTPGSSVFASRFGKWFVLSTGVEYFETFDNNLCTMWISSDGENWQKILEAPKDMWSIKYFMFGAFGLPAGFSEKDEIIFSGQAVKGYDNKIFIAQIVEE